MVAESEKLHGDVGRAPQVVKPEPATAGPVAPRVTREILRLELEAIAAQAWAAKEALGFEGTSAPTARELDDIGNRIERIGKLAIGATRMARTLATRAHVALK